MAKLSEKAVTSASAITHFIVQTADGIRRLTKANLIGIFPAITSGNVEITPTANTAGSIDVTFDTGTFTGVPNVVLTPYATNLDYCSIGGVTKDGFKINYKRPSSSKFTVFWVAVR